MEEVMWYNGKRIYLGVRYIHLSVNPSSIIFSMILEKSLDCYRPQLSYLFFGFLFSFFFLFVFLGPYPRYMEVTSLGVESELLLLAYATATAMQDPSCVFDYSSRQRWILNPLSEARG